MTVASVRIDTRSRRAAIALLGLTVVLVATGCESGEDDVLRGAGTAKVERASVSTRVTSNGALAAVTSQGLGFPKTAQLKEVLVKVGDHVRVGQVLARLDDFAFQQQLNQQQSQLDQQQAQLALLVNGTAVPGSQASLTQARRILSATQRNVQAIKDANEVATRGAQRQLDADRKASDQAASAYHRCLANPPTTSTAAVTDPVTRDSDRSGSATGSADDSDSESTTDPSPRRTFGRRGGGSSYGGRSTVDACAAQQQAKDAATRVLVTDQNAVDAARQKEKVDSTQGQLSVENARQSVVAAQNGLNAASADRPAQIAAQAALVNGARAGVALAHRDVDDTVLRAPVDGTVSAINGAVGEFVSQSHGTTSLAPGSYAALPGGASATGVVGGTDGAGSGTKDAPFLVLNDLHTFQVVVPFPEEDAVRLAAGRPAKVTFDAVPDLTKDGTVLAVAPGASGSSGTVNYYVTILLTDGDPRLKDGVSAEAAVVSNVVDNVLSVPNTAVTRRGDQSSVTVTGPDGASRQVTFQAGLVGDERTQVLAGLTEGQTVQLIRLPVKPGPDGAGGGLRGASGPR